MTSTTEAPTMAAVEDPPARGRKKIVIGVCAMKRKATSKPMREIMAKIGEYYGDWLEFAVFPEQVIMNEAVEQWPLCDCLISFHATDFPLQKAIEYERLRRPYVINDLHRQFDLLDRRKVFRTLARAGIEHPRHGVLIRDPETGEVAEGQLMDNGDTLEVNGMVFTKPFVEKPISAEDHNIYIYYPSSVGGGSQRLFRKVCEQSLLCLHNSTTQINNRSSWYSPISTVRQDGSYVYEDFIPADGTDVKVYAVGPYYAHAEARKAPGLDGKVERDSHGKEVRYPVILTNKEKMIARRVVMAFGVRWSKDDLTIAALFQQTVCGFDLLRANGKSFVCDVNGFSFVKTSVKYYEDTAKILGNMILRRLAYSLSIPWQMPFQADDPPLVATPGGKIMELRCVLAVIRHGDRTPKQKMKIIVNDERLFTLFDKYDGHKKGEIKMKKPMQLEEVLHLAREMLHEQLERKNELLIKVEASEETADIVPPANGKPPVDLEHELDLVEESIKKWDQVRAVLEMYGHFSGINRKVQLKYLKARQRQSSDNDDTVQGPALLLILKWGGELTTAGVLQAEALGKLFRTLYPGIQRTDGKGDAEDTQGLGFLRLHSTYRHDLKIYSSDEGRVQMTAAAFARGLLALEGELTPILVQMVKSANTDGLLDDDCNARQFQSELKSFLHSALQVDREWTADDYEKLNPLGLRAVTNALEFIKNPRRMCEEIAGYVQRMVDIIHWHKLNRPTRSLYLSETWDLAERRWSKELRELRRVNKNGDVDFDISKIPDIYDNIKYDMEHNPDLCINNEIEFERMYLCVKNMADIVVPQEYGIRKEGKLSVAQRVCAPLLAKIRSDLHRCIECSDEDESSFRLDPRASQGIATPYRHVRTRLYFTSESHIHSLMNLIRWGGLCNPNDKKWQRAMNFLSGVTEFNYMTQMVLMVYEDTRDNTNKQGIDRFHVELLFSPGLYPCFQTEKERIYEGRYGSGKPSVPQPASVSPRPNNSGSDASIGSVGGGKPIVDSPSVDMKMAAAVANKELPKGKNNKVSGDASAAESEDELADVSTVNLVALDEITAKQSNYTNEDLARHSPTLPKSPTSPRPPRKRHMTAETEKSTEASVVGSVPVGLIKSFSDVSCSVTNLQDFDEDYDTIERSSTDEPGTSRRSRFPYRFKHHTVNLLTEVDNRLISTDVIRGKDLAEDSRRKASCTLPHRLGSRTLGPAVLSTAIIARSSSAPRLQTYKAEDEIAVNEIRRFWPPLRSLETLHDNLSFKQFDDFLQRLMNVRTPMPSPPKTPVGISRENSDLNGDTSFLKPSPTSPDRTLCDTVKRLSLMEE